jgi:hypothetical protein
VLRPSALLRRTGFLVAGLYLALGAYWHATASYRATDGPMTALAVAAVTFLAYLAHFGVGAASVLGEELLIVFRGIAPARCVRIADLVSATVSSAEQVVIFRTRAGRVLKLSVEMRGIETLVERVNRNTSP